MRNKILVTNVTSSVDNESLLMNSNIYVEAGEFTSVSIAAPQIGREFAQFVKDYA